MKATNMFRIIAVIALAACSLAQAETIQFASLNAKQGMPALFENRARYTDVITGEFTRPANATGNVPVMVIMHSSAGVTDAGTGSWSKDFLKMGIATFVVDSFTPREIKATTSDQSQLSFGATAVDALEALKAVSEIPGVDVNRIGVIGF